MAEKCCHEGHKKIQNVNANHAGMYTCPMHPEVLQKGPGVCPICGMNLEPILVDESAELAEYKKFRFRFIVALLFTLPILYLAMTHGYGWLQALLCLPVLFWAGGFIFSRAIISFRTMQLNMFSLIAIGVGAAYLYSLISLAAKDFLPEAIKVNGHAPLYFETAAMITLLVILGQVFELKARSKTNKALKALMARAPQNAWKVVPSGEGGAFGQEIQIPLSDVVEGDFLRVKPGDNIPVDGIIVEGSSAVDEAMISGEPLPVDKTVGDAVTAGTQNQNGSFVMKAEKVGSATMLARIIHLVSEAQRSQAPIQRIADTVSGYFVPIVVAIAVLTFILWVALGPSPSFTYALMNSVAVLIIACPCALGLATPMSIMVGLGEGAKQGVLIKNADALERLEKTTVLLVDKTGTLTQGKPQVVDVIPNSTERNPKQLLSLAASLEQYSEHPLAHAVLSAAKAQGVSFSSAENFIATPGKGISGTVNGDTVSIVAAEAAAFRELGQTALSIIINDSPAGTIAIADAIKETSAGAVEALHALGIRVVVLSGDHPATVKAVAGILKIDEYHGHVNPEMKLEYVERMKSDGYIVAMAGDGINDAPALAAADIGIAMGTGSDAAIESAPVTLVKGDLNGIVRAIKLSKAVMLNIRQNLFFAFIYNLLGVPLAAGILYPFTGMLLDPMIAAAAMSLSSVSVIINSLRLNKEK